MNFWVVDVRGTDSWNVKSYGIRTESEDCGFESHLSTFPAFLCWICVVWDFFRVI